MTVQGAGLIYRYTPIFRRTSMSSTPTSRILRITTPDTDNNKASSSAPAHHVTHGLTRFQNPWPSFSNPITPSSMFKARIHVSELTHTRDNFRDVGSIAI